MVNLDNSLGIEIDFLEWISRKAINYEDIQKMPVPVFEDFVKRFQREFDKSTVECKQLITSFKKTTPSFFFDILNKAFRKDPIQTNNKIKRAMQRYNDDKVRFKCMIVPRRTDTAGYLEVIRDRWEELHYLSSNYLDIYYSEVDYGITGYEIMRKMSFLPEELKTRAPSIILWDSQISDARGIDINKLTSEEIFDVIELIVNLIRKGYTLNKIAEEASNMIRKNREVKEIRETEHVVNNTITITGSVINGNVTGQNDGTITTIIQEEAVPSQLIAEIETAKQIIHNFNEMDEELKKRLIALIDEAKADIESNDNDRKEKSKSKFKDALFFMGKLGCKLISAFSGLVNVLEYFKISPV